MNINRQDTPEPPPCTFPTLVPILRVGCGVHMAFVLQFMLEFRWMINCCGSLKVAKSVVMPTAREQLRKTDYTCIKVCQCDRIQLPIQRR